MARMVVGAEKVHPNEARRWFIYRDSADRSLIVRPNSKLHLQPRKRDDQFWAVVEVAFP